MGCCHKYGSPEFHSLQNRAQEQVERSFKLSSPSFSDLWDYSKIFSNLKDLVLLFQRFSQPSQSTLFWLDTMYGLVLMASGIGFLLTADVRCNFRQTSEYWLAEYSQCCLGPSCRDRPSLVSWFKLLKDFLPINLSASDKIDLVSVVETNLYWVLFAKSCLMSVVRKLLRSKYFKIFFFDILNMAENLKVFQAICK